MKWKSSVEIKLQDWFHYIETGNTGELAHTRSCDYRTEQVCTKYLLIQTVGKVFCLCARNTGDELLQLWDNNKVVSNLENNATEIYKWYEQNTGFRWVNEFQVEWKMMMKDMASDSFKN
jgi:hypothetical protein